MAETNQRLRSVTLLEREYSGEEVMDAERDVSESLDHQLVENATDEDGIPPGSFKVTVTWDPKG